MSSPHQRISIILWGFPESFLRVSLGIFNLLISRMFLAATILSLSILDLFTSAYPVVTFTNPAKEFYEVTNEMGIIGVYSRKRFL